MEARMNSAILRVASCFLSVLALLASSLAESPATKARQLPITVSFYTGSWVIMADGPGWYPGQNDVLGEGFGPAGNLQIQFNYDLNLSNLQEMTYCHQDYCEDDYSGQINSGTVSFSGYDFTDQNPPYSFAGHAMSGGTFYGMYACYHGDCAWGDNVYFSISGTSSNVGRNPGWWSTGNFSLMGSCLTGGACGGEGSLTLQTYAPGSDAPVSSLQVPLGRWPRDIADLVFLHPSPEAITE
jgi:hypothetical protein